jgi:hypothetical protein
MGMLLTVIIIIIAGIVMYVVCDKGAKIFQCKAIEELRSKLECVDDVSEYSFYTTGHPYVWVESSYDEMLASVEESCIGFQGTPQPARYKMRLSSEHKKIYYVANGLTTLDFGDLMHYDEWLDSKKQLQENITQ